MAVFVGPGQVMTNLKGRLLTGNIFVGKMDDFTSNNCSNCSHEKHFNGEKSSIGFWKPPKTYGHMPPHQHLNFYSYMTLHPKAVH